MAARAPSIDRAGADVHVWVCEVERDAVPTGLDATELDRAERFVRMADRDSYVTAHRLLRTALTWVRPGIPCGEWTFAVTDHERPVLAGPVGGLSFSLSHSSRKVAVAIAREDCGVDVECGERVRDLSLIARTVLTERELEVFASIESAAAQRRFFFRLWTLKESYTKARGLGLRVPFDQVEFTFDPITVIDRTVAESVAHAWDFAQWEDGSDPVAVAFRHGMGITAPRVFRHGPMGDSTERPVLDYGGEDT